MNTDRFERHFFIAAREAGSESNDLPTWADRGFGAIDFDSRDSGSVARIDLPEVPGAFQLQGVLSVAECSQLVAISERMGYQADAPVSLGRNIRHNDNVNWIVDDAIVDTLWSRCAEPVDQQALGYAALGLNARFRFYRYRSGDFFNAHTSSSVRRLRDLLKCSLSLVRSGPSLSI